MRHEAMWRSFWPDHRIRRPIDGARLTMAAVGSGIVVLAAVLAPAAAQEVAGIIPTVSAGLPRAVVSVISVVASLAALAGLVVIAVDAVRSRRFSLTSAVLAFPLGPGLALGIALLASLAVGASVVPLLLGPHHQSAGLPVTAAVAFLVGADLQRRRWAVRTRLAIGAQILCALLLGSLTLISAGFAVLVGTTAGLAVRVVARVLPARPPEELVRSVLARAGWPVSVLRPLTVATGRIRYAAVDPRAGDLRITVVDPDRRGVTLARRGWRLLRLRTAVVGRPALSFRGQLERRALTAALAESAGVPAPRVLGLLAAGPALVLVEQPVAGRPLSAVEDTAATEATEAAWRALRRLHDAGLAHGALSADAMVLLPTGQAGFAALGAAQPAAGDLQRDLDVVALLAATATRLGTSEAVAALRSGYGCDPTAEGRLAALLQPIALPDPVRRAVRHTPLLADLRAALAPDGAAGSVSPPRLERFRPRTVLTVAGATLAVHILATQLSTLDLGGALRSARPAWLAVAVLGSAVTYLGSALVLRAFAPVHLPLGRTTLVQLASSFLTLVTPPAVGQVGLNIRFLQRAQVPTATATAGVAVKEVFTIAVTVPVLLVCGWLTGVSASRLTLLPSGEVLTVLLVAAGVLALVAAAPPARHALRRRLEPLVRRTLPQLVAAVSDPRRLATALLGVLVLDAGYVLAMDASLRAFGVSLALPTLVVVYLAASALGSAAPTPGGLGAVEAALVGGLTATGVPVAAALTAVLVFRTATFWLPAPLGWGAFVLLQRRDWI